MPYATQQDIIDRYGQEDLLVVADRDNDGNVDPDVVDEALADATAEIDTWLAAKYDLPLPSTPSVLVRLCVDITIYRLSSEAGLASEMRRQRYEDAVRLLKGIAKGEASLGLPDPPKSTNGRAQLVSGKRRFDRDKMGRLT